MSDLIPTRTDISPNDPARTGTTRAAWLGPVGLYAAAGVVAATLLAVLVGVPTPVPGLLALTAVAAAGWRLVRHRQQGVVDALLVGVGGALVGIVLTGIVLDLTGVGLRPAGWAAGLAVLATLGLLVDVLVSIRRPTVATPSGTPTAGRRPGLATLRIAPWLVVSVLVVVAAVGVSVRSLSATDEPPLAMSFGAVDGSQVQVVVTTGSAVDALELRTTSEGTDVSYPLFDVGADGTTTTTLSLPRHGRFTITLNHPDQTQPLRTLILDR